MNLIELFTLIANAIRGKKGTEDKINASDFPTEIENIKTGIQQFSSVDEMNESTNNKVGDLAIVYCNSIGNATFESKFSRAIFPSVVVLDSALTTDTYIDVIYRAVDESVMFDGFGNISSSEMFFEGYSESGQIRVSYTSSDGITYTRTDGGAEEIDFGTEVYCPYDDMWNDVIGKFVQVPVNNFNGLYKYIDDYVNKEYIQPLEANTLSCTFTENNNGVIVSDVKQIKEDFKVEDLVKLVAQTGLAEGTNRKELYFVLDVDNNMYFLTKELSIIYDDNCNFYSYGVTNRSDINIYKISDDLSSLSLYTTVTPGTGLYTMVIPVTLPFTLKSLTACIRYSEDEVNYQSGYVPTPKRVDVKKPNGDGRYMDYAVPMNTNVYRIDSRYVPAPTQLNALQENVYGQTFYGKNGVEEGGLQKTTGLTAEQINFKTKVWDKLSVLETESESLLRCLAGYTGTSIPMINAPNNTNMNNMFDGCENLITIPLLDTSKVTLMGSTFVGCRKLTTIPLLDTGNVTNMASMFSNCSSLDEVPLFNTQNVTNMTTMFANCTSLKKVPAFNTQNVTNMSRVFAGCSLLTEIPQYNTSNVTNMYYMFNYCTNLVTVPILDMSKVTSVSNMFSNCTSLSDESLNNILAMCTNAVKVSTSDKTLYRLGLTSAQATRCQSLSNYSAFISAGWTTGY